MLRRSLSMPAIAVILALILLAGACSDREIDGGNASGSSFPALNIMTISFEDEQPRDRSELVDAIEQYTRTRLKVNYVPSAGYGEKSKVVLLSNDLPQVILNTDPKNPHFVNAVQQGAFWDLTDYIKDYPNLSGMNPVIYHNSSIGGRIYGIPRERPLVRSGFIYRKDWLDNLGLDEPKTIDDFYRMIKAFATGDPDRNGKNDTYGIAESKGIEESLLFNLLSWYGSPLNYRVADGKLESAFYSEKYREALNFIRRLYRENLMNPDFAAVQDNGNANLFEKDKAGVVVGTLSTVNSFKELRDAGKLGIQSYVEGPQGPRVFSHSGYFGIYMISKSAVKSEEELRRILDFFDQLGDRDMQNLFKWGIEGVHSVKIDGQYAPVAAEEKSDEQERALSELSAIGGLDPFNKTRADTGVETPMNRRIRELELSTAPFAVADPVAPFFSQTWSEKGEQLKQIMYDANIKYIMGDLNEAGWRGELDKWRKNGGEKVMEEYTAEYNRRIKSSAK